VLAKAQPQTQHKARAIVKTKAGKAQTAREEKTILLHWKLKGKEEAKRELGHFFFDTPAFLSLLTAARTRRPFLLLATAALKRSKSVVAALAARAASFLPHAVAANLPLTSVVV